MPETLTLTRLFKELRDERLEQVIEDLLFDYPYLISDELALPKRQVRLDKESRGDLLFYLSTKLVVVEIKRGAIDAGAVRQIIRYLKRVQLEHKKVQGFLVGTKLTNSAQTLISKSDWKICFRELDKDVPTKIVVCRSCRRARDFRIGKCHFDKSVDIL